MPWIHRDDEVGLILWALDNPSVSGTLNATAPNPVTNREFSKALGRRAAPAGVAPGAEARASSRCAAPELAEQIVGSHRVIPRRAQDLGYALPLSPSVEPALRDLLDASAAPTAR